LKPFRFAGGWSLGSGPITCDLLSLPTDEGEMRRGKPRSSTRKSVEKSRDLARRLCEHGGDLGVDRRRWFLLPDAAGILAVRHKATRTDVDVGVPQDRRECCRIATVDAPPCRGMKRQFRRAQRVAGSPFMPRISA